MSRVQCPFRRHKSEEQRTTEHTEIAEWVISASTTFCAFCVLCGCSPALADTCSAGLGTNIGHAALVASAVGTEQRLC